MILPFTSQACTPETAKKMQEKGFPQETQFYWVKTDKGWDLKYPYAQWWVSFEEKSPASLDDILNGPYAAPTASEALAMLLISTKIHKHADYYSVHWEYVYFSHKNLAEALCWLWVMLVEKGVVKPCK